MNHIYYNRAAGLLAALCMVSGIMLMIAAGARQDVWQELSRTNAIDRAYVLGAVREKEQAPAAEETASSAAKADFAKNPADEDIANASAQIDVSIRPTEQALRMGSFCLYHYLNGTPALEAEAGTIIGPSGKETWYNMNMAGVIDNLRAAGIEGEYGVREDGVKTYGDYIMCAADFDVRPFGTIVETSLGTGIVCDTGEFIYENPYQLDIAVEWD